MVSNPTLWVIGWLASALLGASMFGLGWATQPIDVPLWALLVLTFVPTSDIIRAIQSRLPQSRPPGKLPPPKRPPDP